MLYPETVVEAVKRALGLIKAEEQAAEGHRVRHFPGARRNGEEYWRSFDEVSVVATAVNEVTATLPTSAVAWATLAQEAMDRAARELHLTARIDCTMPQVWVMTWVPDRAGMASR